MTNPTPASVTLTLSDMGDERVSISMGATKLGGDALDDNAGLSPAMLMGMGGQTLFRTGVFSEVGLMIATAVDDGLDTDLLVEKLADAMREVDFKGIFTAAGGTLDAEIIPEES